MRKYLVEIAAGIAVALAVALGIAAALLDWWPDERDPEWLGPAEEDGTCT